MRPSRLSALSAAALALSCCTKPVTPGTAETPGITSPVATGQPLTVPADQKAAVTESLNGTKLPESKDGPWVVRGAGGGGGRGLGSTGGAGGMADGMPAPSARAEGKRMKAMDGPGIGGGPGGIAGAGVRQVMEPSNQPSSSPLHASATDDNAELSEFVKFLASWSDRPDTAGQAQLLDVRDRHFIRVADGQGRALPTAQVQVTDEAADQAIWAGTTFGDGRVPFYPRVAKASGKYVVEASFGGQRGRAHWDGQSDLALTIADAKASKSAIQLDVLFAIDTTGSMQDEIDRIKGSLVQVTEKLKGLKLEFDLRYSAVLFRDLGDDYVTRTYPFTSDLTAFAQALQSVNAGGGGDEPESVNQALAEAVRADWRPGAAKVVFLVGDAPPHMDYQGDVPYGQSLKAAVARGIRIHSVAASGLNPLGTLVWRQVAQFTRGKFIFIEYGSAAATAESHGVTGAYKSNNLDDIVFEQIRDELAYWGKDGPAPNVAAQ